MRLVIYGMAGAAVLFFSVRWIYQDSIQTLVAPGSFTKAHAPYEKKCNECHVPFSKETQNDLCVGCHKETGEDLKKGQGYHGRLDTAQRDRCRSCHGEHLGRDADITGLNRESFDHQSTDFKLTGAHGRVGVSCDLCHPSGKKFREASVDCLGCHKEQDRHKGMLGADCGRCHRETVWKDAYFSHDTTKFPLEGKHGKLACGACHPNAEYKNTPFECVSCHMINDVHDSPVEEKCARCHTADGWKQISFTHDKDTKYPLEGRHAQLRCDACHVENFFSKKLESQCAQCHQAHDVHKGRYGTSCQNCHNIEDWTKVSFDHNKSTKFELHGRHSKAFCDSCHKESTDKIRLDSTCYGCHKISDVHNGQQGTQCHSCHNEESWTEDVTFDHDLTRFPLIGIHAVTPCGECHLSSAFKEAKMECSFCHQADDYHKKKLGTDCERCHNPNGWRLWEFDHDTQTDFRLEGKHAGIACQECHRKEMGEEVEQGKECLACHAREDAHAGRFGSQCGLCHGVESFKQIKEFHRSPEIEDCYACHASEDIHDGQFGRQCGRCHTVKTFKGIGIGQ